MEVTPINGWGRTNKSGRGLFCPYCSGGKLRTERTIPVRGCSRVQRRRCDSCRKVVAVAVVLIEEITPETMATKMREGDLRIVAMEHGKLRSAHL